MHHMQVKVSDVSLGFIKIDVDPVREGPAHDDEDGLPGHCSSLRIVSSRRRGSWSQSRFSRSKVRPTVLRMRKSLQ